MATLLTALHANTIDLFELMKLNWCRRRCQLKNVQGLPTLGQGQGQGWGWGQG